MLRLGGCLRRLGHAARRVHPSRAVGRDDQAALHAPVRVGPRAHPVADLPPQLRLRLPPDPALHRRGHRHPESRADLGGQHGPRAAEAGVRRPSLLLGRRVRHAAGAADGDPGAGPRARAGAPRRLRARRRVRLHAGPQHPGQRAAARTWSRCSTRRTSSARTRGRCSHADAHGVQGVRLDRSRDHPRHAGVVHDPAVDERGHPNRPPDGRAPGPARAAPDGHGVDQVGHRAHRGDGRRCRRHYRDGAGGALGGEVRWRHRVLHLVVARRGSSFPPKGYGGSRRPRSASTVRGSPRSPGR